MPYLFKKKEWSISAGKELPVFLGKGSLFWTNEIDVKLATTTCTLLFCPFSQFHVICLGNFSSLSTHYRARICKLLRSPGIDSSESTSPANVAWHTGLSYHPPGWESIPGLLKRFTNTGSVFQCSILSRLKDLLVFRVYFSIYWYKRTVDESYL